MKKTIKVSLGGSVFTIEEDAYNYLLEYQNALQNQYRRQSGGREILHDIEVRMAELFNYKLDKVKQVITYLDVFEVIEVLGKPENFNEQTSNFSNVNSDEFQIVSDKSSSNYRNTRSEKRWQKHNKKSIFRDVDNRVLGGVCGGLAAYFGTNPVVFRILFILLFFFGGGSILIYIIMWIAIPPAVSVTQKMEMHGEKIDISNIENKVRQELEKLKNQFNKF